MLQGPRLKARRRDSHPSAESFMIPLMEKEEKTTQTDPCYVIPTVELECVLCGDNEPGMIIELRCCHQRMCVTCMEKTRMKPCPYCRKPQEGYLEINVFWKQTKFPRYLPCGNAVDLECRTKHERTCLECLHSMVRQSQNTIQQWKTRASELEGQLDSFRAATSSSSRNHVVVNLAT